MEHPVSSIEEILYKVKHYLPAQAPLKDFIHHNTLHAFQNLNFFEGLHQASDIFGYRTSFSLEEYRELYDQGKIDSNVLDDILARKMNQEMRSTWRIKLLHQTYPEPEAPRIGQLRAHWKKQFKVDLDSMVHPILFRILCSYLDQGVAIWNFPTSTSGFLASVRELERLSVSSFFRKPRARRMLLNENYSITFLLEHLVGEAKYFERYLFDQQFAHQGWSGIVSVIEDNPQTLIDTRKITLQELVQLELLLEIDALDDHFGEGWLPLASQKIIPIENLFAPIPYTELHYVLQLWQEAYEWSYHDQVLAGLQLQKTEPDVERDFTFQALFCIDDRECSLRRYLEKLDHHCQTFGTPGFFGVEFFYQPYLGKFYTKLCPAPITPKYLIKEVESKDKRERDAHFTKRSHNLFQGWLITQTLGFWSAIKLFMNIFRPTMSPATASSFRHMDKFAKLTIENQNLQHQENGLQIGFTVAEMTTRVENLLQSIGLIKNFAPVIYLIGHGSSSVNNPHYAAYDCGACSGRAGSVNSRVMCFMANHAEVRKRLREKGITIPDSTQFIGGLHDTTRDEIVFFDEDSLSPIHLSLHQQNELVFRQALDYNSKERSRRFESINTHKAAEDIHDEVKLRSVALFEPRPELNHATNALCLVGRRSLTKGLFLDRRAFMNSYDYHIDPDGIILQSIIRPLGPVCGGINLEYFFSRVDNQKLGAGTKLPHNVMGLIGVANGIDGDLRPGLPSQMVEVHDPVRLLIVIEHFPEVVLKTIKKEAATWEWFANEWVLLAVIHPETKELFKFTGNSFIEYHPVHKSLDRVDDLVRLLESHRDNIPVSLIS